MCVDLDIPSDDTETRKSFFEPTLVGRLKTSSNNIIIKILLIVLMKTRNTNIIYVIIQLSSKVAQTLLKVQGFVLAGDKLGQFMAFIHVFIQLICQHCFVIILFGA